MFRLLRIPFRTTGVRLSSTNVFYYNVGRGSFFGDGLAGEGIEIVVPTLKLIISKHEIRSAESANNAIHVRMNEREVSIETSLVPITVDESVIDNFQKLGKKIDNVWCDKRNIEEQELALKGLIMYGVIKEI